MWQQGGGMKEKIITHIIKSIIRRVARSELAQYLAESVRHTIWSS